MLVSGKTRWWNPQAFQEQTDKHGISKQADCFDVPGIAGIYRSQASGTAQSVIHLEGSGHPCFSRLSVCEVIVTVTVLHLATNSVVCIAPVCDVCVLGRYVIQPTL